MRTGSRTEMIKEIRQKRKQDREHTKYKPTSPAGEPDGLGETQDDHSELFPDLCIPDNGIGLGPR